MSIAVTPVNDAPTANADTATTAEDTALTVAAVNGVLANDSDPDSLLITAARVANPAHGTLALATQRLVRLHAGRELERHRHLHVPCLRRHLLLGHRDRDHHGDAGQRPPVAANDGPYSTPEGTALALSAPGVLANDTT